MRTTQDAAPERERKVILQWIKTIVKKFHRFELVYTDFVKMFQMRK